MQSAFFRARPEARRENGRDSCSVLGQPAEEAGGSGTGSLAGQPVVCGKSRANLPDGLRSADETEHCVMNGPENTRTNQLVVATEHVDGKMEKMFMGEKSGNPASSDSENTLDDVRLEDVFDERRLSRNIGKRKKRVDLLAAGGGETRKNVQSLSDEEETELTASQEGKTTSSSVEKIRRFSAETEGQRAVKTEQFFPGFNAFIRSVTIHVLHAC